MRIAFMAWYGGGFALSCRHCTAGGRLTPGKNMQDNVAKIATCGLSATPRDLLSCGLSIDKRRRATLITPASPSTPAPIIEVKTIMSSAYATGVGPAPTPLPTHYSLASRIDALPASRGLWLCISLLALRRLMRWSPPPCERYADRVFLYGEDHHAKRHAYWYRSRQTFFSHSLSG